MMRINNYYSLIIILVILMIVPGISAEYAGNQDSIDHLRSILHVPDNEGLLTGLTLTIAVIPDRYYLENGTEITITGTLTSMFGPVVHSPVVIARGYQEKPTAITDLTTDENGRFTYSDLINRTGAFRYQAWYSSPSREKSHALSPEIEVMGIQKPLPTENGSNTSPSNQFSGENETFSPPASSAIILEADSTEYTSGKNVTFSGAITGAKGIPLPHSIVFLEMAYDDGKFTRVGETLSADQNGTFRNSFHLTGPLSPVFRAVSSDLGGHTIISNEIQMTFVPEGFVPPARSRTDSRHIDASLFPSVIEPGEPISISGWFSDGKGEPVISGRLNLYWYNFGDQIWDRYQMGSEAITTPDGYYSFNVSGPRLPGVSYMAVVSKYEKNGVPLFSSVLFPTIRDHSGQVSPDRSAELKVTSTPDLVSVGETAEITLTLTDSAGNPLTDERLNIFFSQDGFTWLMNGNDNLTTSSEGIITLTDTPWEPGFHYYKGFFNGTREFRPVQSEMLILPILEGDGSERN